MLLQQTTLSTGNLAVNRQPGYRQRDLWSSGYVMQFQASLDSNHNSECKTTRIQIVLNSAGHQSSDTPNKAWSCEPRISQESNCTRNFKSACDCYDSGAERRSAWAISQATPHVTTLLRIAAMLCCSVLLLCSALCQTAQLLKTNAEVCGAEMFF